MEPRINSATHLHASALSSRRRQILDVAPLRLRFVSSFEMPTYEYVKTGEVMGKCMSFADGYAAK